MYIVFKFFLSSCQRLYNRGKCLTPYRKRCLLSHGCGTYLLTVDLLFYITPGFYFKLENCPPSSIPVNSSVSVGRLFIIWYFFSETIMYCGIILSILM